MAPESEVSSLYLQEMYKIFTDKFTLTFIGCALCHAHCLAGRAFHLHNTQPLNLGVEVQWAAS
jgi:hypothetical protein